jgi:hypothetical protein
MDSALHRRTIDEVKSIQKLGKPISASVPLPSYYQIGDHPGELADFTPTDSKPSQ